MNRKLVLVEYANSPKYQPRRVYVAVEAPWLDILLSRCKEAGHYANVELEDMVALGVPQCAPATPQFWLPHDWNAFATWLKSAHEDERRQAHEKQAWSDAGVEIQSTLVLSYSHLQHGVMERMSMWVDSAYVCEAHPITQKTANGYRVYCGESEGEGPYRAAEGRNSLIAAIEAGRHYGCLWVEFDPDGNVVEFLDNFSE